MQLSCHLQGVSKRSQKEVEGLIRSVRMDHLGTWSTERSWESLGIKPQDILVVNAGSHWWGSVQDASGAFLNQSKRLLTLGPRAVVFRTTVMGHRNCNEFVVPFKELSKEEKAKLSSKY